MKDLLEHEKVYEQRLQLKLRERREKREKWYKDIGFGDYDPSIYQSKYLSSIEKEEKAFTPDPIVGVIDQIDKKKNYSKFVKEMHKPKISIRKKEEMSRIIKEVEESGMSRKLVLNKYSSQKEINKNRSKSIESALNYRRSKDDLLENKDFAYGGSSSALKKRKKWFNPMLPRPKLKRKGIIIDYLLKRRIKRQEKEMLDPDYMFKNNTNWDAFGVTKSQRAQAKSFSIDYRIRRHPVPPFV